MASLKKLLKKAADAFNGASLNIQKFAWAYVEIDDNFDQEALDAFKAQYPMFGNREWERLGWVGDGFLMPEFFFKSDSSVCKVVKMKKGQDIQQRIIEVSKDETLTRCDRESKIKALMRKVNKTCEKHGRSARRILADMAEEVVKYSHLRDDEWDFEEKHGQRDMWDDEACEKHDQLLEDIQKSRDRLTALVREATGDETIDV